MSRSHHHNHQRKHTPPKYRDLSEVSGEDVSAVRNWIQPTPIRPFPLETKETRRSEDIEFAALVAETDDGGVTLVNSAEIPFSVGISTTNNIDIIIISNDGTTIEFKRDGMFRFVLEASILAGSPLNFELKNVSRDNTTNDGFNLLPFLREGFNSSSTILSLKVGDKIKVVPQSDKHPVTLGGHARLQVYRVG